MHDLLVHASTSDGGRISLAASDGVITELGKHVSGSALEEIDYGSAILRPGWIDSHVHFNEPGRTDWEGLHHGSLALAAGGGTTFFDMPLNSSPPVVSREAFELKRQTAEEKSHLDFALWAGLTPLSLPALPAMAEAGAVGFKAFMCNSGLDEFPSADEATLTEGMKIAASLDLPVAVHAELADGRKPTGKDMASWIASRPISFELDAIRLALELASETDCRLHIVHVTCPEGIDLITTAKACGIRVTVETCPHYLLLSDHDGAEIGVASKCAPPLRPAATIAALRERLMSGQIDTVGSDHSPSAPELKREDDIAASWGGIAGIQHGLPLLRELAGIPDDPLSSNVAKLFRIPHKGSLTPGHHADFTLWETSHRTISPSDLLSRHPLSPYLGFKLSTRIAATFLRGKPVTSSTRGQFLSPSPS